MKRRDFIKGFAAVSAAVPIASALASTKGAESVIETFQMSDIEPEVLSHISYVPETIFQDKPNQATLSMLDMGGNWNDVATANNVTINHREMIEHRDTLCPVLVLASDHPNFRHWVQGIKSRYSKTYENYLDRFKFVYIRNAEQLLGIQRNLRVVGIRDYWYHSKHNEIMDMIHSRSIEIYTPNKLVNVINYNNKLWDY